VPANHCCHSRAHLDILVTSNTGALPLPIAYLPSLEAVPGIEAVAYLAGMDGYTMFDHGE
jgi:hypothetical protein